MKKRIFEPGDVVEYDHSVKGATPNFYIKMHVIRMMTATSFRACVLECNSREEIKRYQVGNVSQNWYAPSFKKVIDPVDTLLTELEKLEERYVT